MIDAKIDRLRLDAFGRSKKAEWVCALGRTVDQALENDVTRNDQAFHRSQPPIALLRTFRFCFVVLAHVIVVTLKSCHFC